MDERIRNAKLRISQIMNSEKISQSGLASKTSMEQSRISKCLNLQDDAFFSVPQLLELSDCIGFSLDELLGIDQTKKTKSRHYTKILSMLFEIVDKENVFFHTEGSEDRERTDTYLCFFDSFINTTLLEYSQFHSFICDSDIKKQVIETWKDGAIKKAQRKDEALEWWESTAIEEEEPFLVDTSQHIIDNYQ